jgi:hypothetical protein
MIRIGQLVLYCRYLQLILPTPPAAFVKEPLCEDNDERVSNAWLIDTGYLVELQCYNNYERNTV